MKQFVKAKSSLKHRNNQANHITHEAFANLKEALEGALAFERGERRELRVTRIQAPRPPKAM